MGKLIQRIGIYKIENKVNGKVYIGQSINIRKRFIEHRYRAFDDKDEKTYGLYLYSAMRKYGTRNFSFSIIEECEPDMLNEREIYWINFYKSNQKEYGYNLSDGGDSKYSRNLTANTNVSQRKQRVFEIIDLLINTDIPIQEIAQRYNVSTASITNINRGHSWHFSDASYPLRDTRKPKEYYCPKCGAKLSTKYSKLCRKCDSERQHYQHGFPGVDVMKYDVNNYGLKELSKKYGVSEQTVYKWSKKYGVPLKGWNQERRLKYEQV